MFTIAYKRKTNSRVLISDKIEHMVNALSRHNCLFHIDKNFSPGK